MASYVSPNVVFKNEFISSAQTITTGGALVIAHGLGTIPKLVTVELVCITAEAGFAINDIVQFGFVVQNASVGFSCIKDATNLKIRMGSNANALAMFNAGTGTGVNLTNANWNAVFKAYA